MTPKQRALDRLSATRGYHGLGVLICGMLDVLPPLTLTSAEHPKLHVSGLSDEARAAAVRAFRTRAPWLDTTDGVISDFQVLARCAFSVGVERVMAVDGTVLTRVRLLTMQWPVAETVSNAWYML